MSFLRYSLSVLLSVVLAGTLFADGKVMPKRNYKGSLEESAQEAILIFHGSDFGEHEAVQDMILKIEVEGDAEEFAWIIPLPNEPKIAKEDPQLFKELFDYVEHQKRRTQRKKLSSKSNEAKFDGAANKGVEVLKRETVGDFEIATIRETEQGGLNPWLEEEGYQTLEDAEDVLDFYREKDYVYVCIKVSSEVLANEKKVESHPLRFTFRTGGDDGVFFPMKLTGLQTQRFDVNLYVFYRAWLNADLNKYGYRNRGMNLRYRDWDTSKCKKNGGKGYSLPEEDALLASAAHTIPSVKKLFQKLHPGERYYLTNVYAQQLEPDDVRNWSDDLWMFPHYTDRSFVPFDARPDDWVEVRKKPEPQMGWLNIRAILMLAGVGTLAAILGLVLFVKAPRGNTVVSKKPPANPSKPDNNDW